MSFWLLLLFSFFFVRYALPTLLRAVLGGFVRQQVHKAQHPGGPFGPIHGGSFGPQGPGRPAGSPPAPGQVRVDYVPPKPATSRPDSGRMGEYVDFEEI